MSGKISKEIEKVMFFVGPFVRYWDIAESDKTNIAVAVVDEHVKGEVAIQESDNYTLESGVQLGVSF